MWGRLLCFAILQEYFLVPPKRNSRRTQNDFYLCVVMQRAIVEQLVQEIKDMNTVFERIE